MDLSLPDQYVLLLQDVVKENKLLREQMRQTIEAGKSSLQEINAKVDKLAAVQATVSTRRPVRQTGRPVRVPRVCSNNVRRKLKTLKASDANLSFRFNESPESEQNNMLFSKMKEELDHEYGGQDKCPWSVIVLKEAFKTYFKSSKASHVRISMGNHEKHVQVCRRRNRKDEKLARRLKSLNKASWNKRKVAKIAEVLTVSYMSSEESELDEETNRVMKYNVHRLPWESSKLRKAKKRLDKVHKESLPGLVQRLIFPRELGQQSTRAKPYNCPDWACTNQEVTASNVDDGDVNAFQEPNE